MAIVDAGTGEGIGAGEQVGQTAEVDNLIASHSDPSINRYKTFDAFVAGHKELEGKLGNAIQPLADDATPEQKRVHYTKFGCPETVEGFEIVKPQLPEGMEYDDELIKAAAQYAYDNGMKKGVFEGLAKLVFEGQAKKYGELITATKTAQDQAIETAENELKGKHGAKYDEVVEMANRFYDLPGDDKVNKAFTDLMAQHGLNSHPAVVDFMYESYKMVKEDEIPGGGTGAGAPVTKAGQLSYPKSPGMQKS